MTDLYAEDIGQELPEDDSIPEFGLTHKSRTFSDLADRGFVVRFSIKATENDQTCGLALKFEQGAKEQDVQRWLKQAAEAIHRHIDTKEDIMEAAKVEVNG